MYYFPPHLTLNMLPHYLWEFKSSNLAQIWKKMQTKISHEPVVSIAIGRKSHEQTLNLPAL